MSASVARAQRPEVVGGLGGFAGLFDASALRAYDRPLLASSTDGVGTKVAIAQRMDVHDTIGIDLVGDGRRRPRRLRRRAAVHDRLHRRRQGRARADRRDRRGHRRGLRGAPAARWSAARPPSTRGCWTRTSTTSPAPAPASSRPTTLLGPERVRAGDVVDRDARLAGCTPTATRWSGTCCSTGPGCALDLHVAELGRTLGEELLEPTRIYALDCLALARGSGADVHAFSPRHRRRARRQPGPGAATGGAPGGRPRDLDPAPGVRAGRRARPGRRARSWSRRSTWGSAWWPSSPPTRSTPRSPGWPSPRRAGVGARHGDRARRGGR